MALSILMVLIYIALKLTVGTSWPQGLLTLTVLIMVSTDLNGLFVGILGEYIARLHAQLTSPTNTIIYESTEIN